MYTEMYTTGSLAAWARAFKLRSDPHAQKEIQDLADMWNQVIGGIKELENSWRALTQ
jgi:thymidylate synthase (FAD)